jgi:chemotaxis protein MotA
MDAELEAQRTHAHAVAGALQTVADGMPALGIVAAVLGVIHTWGRSPNRRRSSAS